jgi:hypothetical protein
LKNPIDEIVEGLTKTAEERQEKILKQIQKVKILTEMYAESLEKYEEFATRQDFTKIMDMVNGLRADLDRNRMILQRENKKLIDMIYLK